MSGCGARAGLAGVGLVGFTCMVGALLVFFVLMRLAGLVTMAMVGF